jgi:hypothetical protein
MHIRRLGGSGDRWAATVWPLGAACLLTAVGCAHHRADQYAYAPPYAPPVYPQPQVQMPVQPATPTVAAPGLPAGALPPGAMVAAAASPGMVVPAVGGECPPCAEACAEGGQGVVVSSGVMPGTAIEAVGQTPPCPPGP